MKRFRPLLLLLILGPLQVPAAAWGPAGHRWVTGRAIDGLQGPAAELFRLHARALVERSMDADYRKDDDPDEFFRHFIDLERYGTFPFRELDLDYRRLVGRIGKERVRENGTVLWASEASFQRLVEALRKEDEEAFLRHASDLAHYVADLHQPFHASENYNGQLSGQEGIHFRFEGDLVDRTVGQIHFSAAPLRDLGPVVPLMHRVALESQQWVDNILLADLEIVRELGIDRQEYRWDPETRKAFPEEYFRKMQSRVGPILERRLVEAARTLASLWWMAFNQSRERR